MTCQMRTYLGVYVLGAADAKERSQVDAHLPGCAECQAELTSLAALPGLLTIVPDDRRPAPRTAGPASRTVGAASPTAGAPPGRAGRPAGRARRQARLALPSGLRRCFNPPLRATAPAVSVAVAAGFALGYWLMPAATGHTAAAETFTGVNNATHVVATASLTPTSWGTSIQLQLRGIPLNSQCRLIARSRTGATEVTGVWDAWGHGPVNVPASAGWRMPDIASLQVMAGAKTLVTISTGSRPTALGKP
jgi:Putative zinc-finger